MTDTIDQRNELVEAITREVLAALGSSGSSGTPADSCTERMASVEEAEKRVAQRCRPEGSWAAR